MFKIDKTIDDFNSYVYDSSAMNYITNLLDSKDMNARANEVRNLLEMCAKSNMPVYIFSNAPIKWSEMVTSTLGLSIDSDKVLGSDHPVFEKNDHLKPHKILYNDVRRLINHRYKIGQEIVFVDDSLQNLIPCVQMEHWTPVLLLPGVSPLYTEPIKVCSSIQDIMNLM